MFGSSLPLKGAQFCPSQVIARQSAGLGSSSAATTAKAIVAQGAAGNGRRGVVGASSEQGVPGMVAKRNGAYGVLITPAKLRAQRARTSSASAPSKLSQGASRGADIAAGLSVCRQGRKGVASPHVEISGGYRRAAPRPGSCGAGDARHHRSPSSSPRLPCGLLSLS